MSSDKGHPGGLSSQAMEPEVSTLRASIPDAIVLVRADDPDKKPLLYACGKCGQVHSPRVYACSDDRAHEAARKAAEDCYNCKEHNVCACGAKCPKYWTACEDCREQKLLDAAVEVADDGGPYFKFGGDTYYQDLEYARDDGCEWVSPCTITYPKIDADDVLDSLLSDMHEDASVDDLNGVGAFYAAVEAFNKAQTQQTWWGDSKRKINVAKAMDARQGGNGEAGAVHDSAVAESHLPERTDND